MFKRYLQFIFMVLPILFLMLLGGYFGYKSWHTYRSNVALKSHLENAKLLQSLEHSVLNEIVCIVTVGNHKNLMDKVCKKTQETTNFVMKQIMQQKDDTSLYTLEKNIFEIRNSIKNSGSVAIEKLVNGHLNKEMNTLIQKYTNMLKEYSDDMDKKEYLNLYADISRIAYATEAEKALIAYYLSLKKPIPSTNLIYWDKIINQSQIPELDNEKISILYADIADTFKEKKFQKTLRQIEDIRLDIMTNSARGQYKSDISTWVSLLNNKQKVLHTVETMLLDTIFNDTSKKINQSLFMLILSSIALFFALLGFLLLLSYWKKNRVKSLLLTDLVDKISEVNSDEKLKVTENIESQKVAYNYIASSYESLHEKEVAASEENKTNRIFLSNLAYEIRTPLNGISGYTKLLKETPLNFEQDEYLNMIENNFANLETLLDKISQEKSLSSQKLELEDREFDLVRQIESSVETFSIKADQKDIVLGLYIDPMLAYKVKGDGIKLSQIITNLIDNALDVSSAYHTIDISVEKLHSDAESVNIKFDIVDQGIGFDEVELQQIRNGLGELDTNVNIGNINMRNLNITNKIIKRMGGNLEFESKKGEGSRFFFTLTFEKSKDKKEIEVYPTFDGMKVGLALPSHEINRQIDKNLESYVKHLRCTFEIYDYETLFEDNHNIELPDLLFVYHNYARLEGELEKFAALPVKIALITSGSLRARINTEKYTFSSIVYAPITMKKIIKILTESKLNISEPIEAVKVVSQSGETQEEEKKFNGLEALLVEDNEISQKILTDQLKKLGMQVTVSSSGAEAFELRKEKAFDIIFMDVDMPMMNGMETTSKILYYEGVNQLDHTPIIALAQDLSDQECNKYLKAGMDDCMHTKINEKEMYELIHKHCIELPKKMAQSEEDELIAKVLSGDFLKE